MTNHEFRWWMRGFYELCEPVLDVSRLFVIRNHLNLVKAVDGSWDQFNQGIFDAIAPYTQENATAKIPGELAQEIQRLVFRTGVLR